MRVDLLIHSAAQLITCASPGGPKRGAAMRELGIIKDGAVAISDGVITAVGPSDELRRTHDARRTIDAAGQLVCPGFVDPHTHLVYAGDRVAEWEMKLRGAAYLDILAAGGGILSTMRATREASLEQLVASARKRLDAMLRNGVTTCEIKTGYGLSVEAELKMLCAIAVLMQTHPCEVIPTLLAAHAVPPEFASNPDGYVDLVVEEIIPQAAAWLQSSIVNHQLPMFVDVFCENNAFDVEQSRRILMAGKQLGLLPKIHADQFNTLGGVPMALELGAVSCDHLDVTTAEDRARLAQSDAIAVVLPAVNFHLGSAHFSDARAMIDAGCAVALATDHNPGSAPCLSPALVMAIACRHQKLTPAEALNACTINAAHALGISDHVGSLEAGKQADVLIVSAPDYRHLAYQFGVNLVETVIKRGEVV
ncbi:MAG: imidazolonepropionase [Candidatus Roseilinea sp.]|nr:MAG: imidazolonepropionase [Candidatus Roseilinea sp.]